MDINIITVSSCSKQKLQPKEENVLIVDQLLNRKRNIMNTRIIVQLFLTLIFGTVSAQVQITGGHYPGPIVPVPEITFDTITDFVASPGEVNAKKLVYYGEDNSSNVNSFSIQVFYPVRLAFHLKVLAIFYYLPYIFLSY